MHDPAQSRFLGTRERKVKLGTWVVSISMRVDLQSTRTDFHIVLSRKLFENGHLVEEKFWDEVIPSDFQKLPVIFMLPVRTFWNTSPYSQPTAQTALLFEPQIGKVKVETRNGVFY